MDRLSAFRQFSSECGMIGPVSAPGLGPVPRLQNRRALPNRQRGASHETTGVGDACAILRARFNARSLDL
jgi:hypothetical protein